MNEHGRSPCIAAKRQLMHATARAVEPADSTLALRAAGLALAGVILSLTWVLGGGWRGCVYLAIYCLTAAPGLPVGFLLFGRHHAAGWIGGAIVGYALSAFALWLPAPLHFSSLLAPAISGDRGLRAAACLSWACARGARRGA